jgi:hypothetical protein
MKKTILIFAILGIMLIGSLGFAIDCIGEPTAHCYVYASDRNNCNNHFETSGHQCYWGYSGHFSVCTGFQPCSSSLTNNTSPPQDIPISGFSGGELSPTFAFMLNIAVIGFVIIFVLMIISSVLRKK